MAETRAKRKFCISRGQGIGKAGIRAAPTHPGLVQVRLPLPANRAIPRSVPDRPNALAARWVSLRWRNRRVSESSATARWMVIFITWGEQLWGCYLNCHLSSHQVGGWGEKEPRLRTASEVKTELAACATREFSGTGPNRFPD